MHIPTQYIFIFTVRIYIINTCIYIIYVHIRARRKVVIWYGFLKKVHVFCMYFNVYAHIWCSILSVYCACVHKLYVYARIDAPSNFPHRKCVQIRTYVQIRANTYRIYVQIHTNTTPKRSYTDKIHQLVYARI